MLFEHFPLDSRVWVYGSNRQLSLEEQDSIQSELNAFMNEWAAHGNSLFGRAAIFHDRFVVLLVDESKVPASGCSIDTSVNFIKTIGQKYNVDFFDRLNMTILDGDEFTRVHIADLKDYPEAIVFNPMITSLKELNENWQVRVAESLFV